MKISMPKLPFRPAALEPYISRATIDLHYGKHHAGYVSNTNRLLERSGIKAKNLEDIVRKAHDAGETALFNNAAQAWNHAFYWNSLHPGGGGACDGAIATLIDRDFGSQDAFLEQLSEASVKQFGSGWAWVVLDDGRLKITPTANADNPLITSQAPLLVIDLWEHAYYLDYQNRRPDYVRDVLGHLVNWQFANDNLDAVTALQKAS